MSNMPTQKSYSRLSPDYTQQVQEELRHSGIGVSLEVFGPSATDYHVTVTRSDLLTVITGASGPLRASPAKAEMPSDNSSVFLVLFQQEGRALHSSGTKQTIISPGDIFVTDANQTFEIPDVSRKVCLLIPRATFERIVPTSNDRSCVHMRAGESISRLLGGCLAHLAQEVLPSRPEDLEVALELTLDILGAALMRHGETARPAVRQALFERIVSFIERQLADSDLSPSILAHKHGISKRYLHMIFAERNTTVRTWIRNRRLAHCRAELSNLRNDKSVTEIAFRWGFKDSAYFSRAFHSAYGVSPTKFRGAHQAGFVSSTGPCESRTAAEISGSRN